MSATSDMIEECISLRAENAKLREELSLIKYKGDPVAWRRVSRITGLSTGVFESKNVELRSEILEPLYAHQTIISEGK